MVDLTPLLVAYKEAYGVMHTKDTTIAEVQDRIKVLARSSWPIYFLSCRMRHDQDFYAHVMRSIHDLFERKEPNPRLVDVAMMWLWDQCELIEQGKGMKTDA